jgi:hypothetical protein
MVETFKLLDLFGQNVNLNWNGQDKFRTTFGAIVTLVLFAVLIAFAVFKGNDILKRLNPSVSKISYLRTPS